MKPFGPARLAVLAVVATALVPGAAAADGPVGVRSLATEDVTASGAAARDCLQRAPRGAAGIATRTVTVPGSGVVAAKLDALAGDWDLAVFDDLTGRRIAGSAAFGANELAEGFAGGGREVVVQACRRSGAGRARLEVTGTPVPVGTSESKPSLYKVFVERPIDRKRLVQADLDLTDHDGHDYVEVVAYGARDVAKIRRLGLRATKEVDDLVQADRKRAAADRRSTARARAAQASGMPSGRTEYRRLEDYEKELKQLAERHPNLVKPITLPFKTLEGRDVVGVEITDDVKASDGKPVFLQMGVHHAREWPSGEHAMEWAHELVNGFGKDDRTTRLVKSVRTIVVPIVNPDGFNLSRNAPVDLQNDPAYEQVPDKDLTDTIQGGTQTGSYLVDPFFNYKRRNCRVVPGAPTPPGACALPANRTSGVDPNRNYGGFWGGPGASALPAYDTYRGPGPFSEPETQNIQRLVSSRQVTTLITNHTFSNLVLRPPGIRAQGPSPDEGVYKALGDAMAAKNGYASQFSFDLYDTTGTTEDWSYYATGGLGFTFEIGPDTNEANCGGFHPAYACTAKQYTSGANGAGGNREAYFTAMENAADKAKHSTLTGTAPAGAKLRVKKEFLTETSPVQPFQTDVVDTPQGAQDKIRFKDKLETTLDVPRDGKFSWSINPSTRPIVADNSYRGVAETPVRTVPFTKDKQTSPNPSGSYTEANYEDETFSISPQEAGFTTVVSLQGTAADDYDLELFRRQGGELVKVGDSGNLPTETETIVLQPAQAGDYVLRVYNYAAAGPYTGKAEIFGEGPVIVKAGTKEAWTLECEVAGKVLSSQKVVVDRGQQLRINEPCGANARQVAAAARSGRSTAQCGSSAGFRSAAVKPVRGGQSVRFDFARRVPELARIDVFQVSRGRAVLGERRVASFPGRQRSFTWTGAGNDGKPISDGVFFVRFTIKGARARTDVRRVTLVRRGGKFSVRRTFYRPDSCGLLASAKLERPAFGGRRNDPLRVAFRVARRADVTVTVKRGAKTVRTIRSRGRAARRTHRLRIAGAPVKAKGLYTVKISVRSGGRRASATLTGQRL